MLFDFPLLYNHVYDAIAQICPLACLINPFILPLIPKRRAIWII